MRAGKTDTRFMVREILPAWTKKTCSCYDISSVATRVKLYVNCLKE